MIYEIAGLRIEMNPQYSRLQRQSEAYLSSGKSIFRVDPHVYADANLQNRTEEDREYIFSSASFCRELLSYGRFFLHASAVVLDGEAYLFSAPSGTGKSTHTAFWLKSFQGSYILNDDKPIIEPKMNGDVSAWGSPFAGKTELHMNREVPLRAICFLERGDENRITPISEERAIARTLNNTYRPKDAEKMNLLLDMIEKVVARVDIFEMRCKNESAAAEVSYNAMKGT